MTNLRHYDHLGTARFVTFSCYRRYPLLQDTRAINILIEHLKNIRVEYKIKIYGYVVMPEHVHLVLYPPDEIKLGEVIGKLKGLSSKEIQRLPMIGNPTLKGGAPSRQVVRDGRVRNVFWQRRCYDHNCRTAETTLEKIEYCHNNPVKRGRVAILRNGNGRITIGIRESQMFRWRWILLSDDPTLKGGAPAEIDLPT